MSPCRPGVDRMTAEAMSTSPVTVREATINVIRELGLTTIFANPSHTEMKLFESWPSDIRVILGLQEAPVVTMADGYAQATGEPALVIINGAPGLGNALGSIYTAARAHTPLIILGGQQARALLLGEPFLLAEDPTLLPRPYVKWSAQPSRPQDVPALLERAYHIARQAPQGPVFIAVPEDDWIRPAAPQQTRVRQVRGAVVPDPTVTTQLARALTEAQRPALVAGPGVDAQGARHALVQVAERLNATVYGSPVWPRGAFPETHPLFGGVLPPIQEMINERLQQHDLVVVFGAPAFTLFTMAELFQTAPMELDPGLQPRLPDTTEVIAVTDDPAAAAWSMAGTTYVCPPGEVVRQLLPLLEPSDRPVPPPQEVPPAPSTEDGLTQPVLFHALADVLPPDVVIFEELPIARHDFHQYVRIGADGGYFATAGGALGFAFAGAVGYALARPDKRVLAVVGEGSAQYTLHAIWTAVQHRLPVTFLIPDNSGYLSLKYYLRDQKAFEAGWALPGLDMVAIAQGYGCPARRVESIPALRDELRAALTADGPFLLDVPVGDPGLFQV